MVVSGGPNGEFFRGFIFFKKKKIKQKGGVRFFQKGFIFFRVGFGFSFGLKRKKGGGPVSPPKG